MSHLKIGDWDWGLIIPHLTTDMLQHITDVLSLGFNFETVEATES